MEYTQPKYHSAKDIDDIISDPMIDPMINDLNGISKKISSFTETYIKVMSVAQNMIIAKKRLSGLSHKIKQSQMMIDNIRTMNKVHDDNTMVTLDCRGTIYKTYKSNIYINIHIYIYYR